MYDSSNILPIERLIDRIADAFEAAWRVDQPAKLEEYLVEVAENCRATLFQELLAVELQLRRERGEDPRPADYEARFAHYGDGIRAAFELADDTGDPQSTRVEPSSGLPTRAETLVCHRRGVGAESEIERSRTIEAGAHFERFQLLEELGKGGFGTVWKAHDRVLKRLVALKIPRVGRLPLQDGSLLMEEARNVARLKHPGVVQVYDAGVESGTAYIASEYIAGSSLHEQLKGERLSCRRATEICLSVAEALHHAHKMGIVHRDLKPANILLDDTDDATYVADFGLAKSEGQEYPAGQLVGTASYMAPEQAAGRTSDVDRRSDIYSLGVILYEMITGHRPFRDESNQVAKTAETLKPIRPRRLNRAVPRDLEAICLRCLKHAREDRYATAADLAADLDRHLRGEAVAARPLMPPVRLARWARRRPAIAALALLSLTLLVTIVVGVRDDMDDTPLPDASAPPQPTTPASMRQDTAELLPGFTSNEDVFRLENVDEASDRIANLAAQETIVNVDLHGLNIGDPQIEPLLKMSRLKKIDLRRTSVTPIGYARLAAALPNAELFADEDVVHPVDREVLKHLLEILEDINGVYVAVLTTTPSGESQVHINLIRKDQANDLANALFMITRIDLWENRKVGHAGIPNLEHLRGLAHFGCDGSTVTEDILKQLAAIPTLTNLSANRCSSVVSSEVLQAWATLPNLQVLWVERAVLDDQGMAAVTSMARLRNLNISYSSLTDRQVEAISHLDLIDLNLDGSSLKEGQCRYLQESSVKYLRLHDSTLSDQDLRDVATLPNLESIHLERTNVSDVTVVPFASVPHLLAIWLDNTQITGTGLRNMQGPLKVFYLHGCPITDEGLEAICTNRELRELYLTSSRVSDDGVAHVANLHKLDQLKLVNSQITDNAVKYIAEASNIHNLWLDNTSVGDQTLAGLRSSNIRWLELSRTQITDAGLKYLAEIRSLDHLNLSDTKVTDTGVVQLKHLRRLRHLDLSGAQVTPQGVAELKRNLPDCEIVAENTNQKATNADAGETRPSEPRSD